VKVVGLFIPVISMNLCHSFLRILSSSGRLCKTLRTCLFSTCLLSNTSSLVAVCLHVHGFCHVLPTHHPSLLVSTQFSSAAKFLGADGWLSSFATWNCWPKGQLATSVEGTHSRFTRVDDIPRSLLLSELCSILTCSSRTFFKEPMFAHLRRCSCVVS